MKTVFVVGATGAVGSVLVPYLRESHFAVIPHVRPKTAEHHPLGKDHRALIADLSDTARLDEQMARAHSVVCLVGTTRRRFAAGDTYESSDYRPVVQLLESARRAPLPEPRHFVLVSSLGAKPGSGYLGWKHGAQRKPPPLVAAAFQFLGKLSPLRGVSDDLRPLPVDVLCLAIARIVRERAPFGTLKGRQLWELGLNPPARMAAER